MRWLGGLRLIGLASADANGRLAQQAVDDLASVVLFDQLVFSAFRVRTLDGEDHWNFVPKKPTGCNPWAFLLNA